MVVMLIVLVALGTIAGLTVISVQGGAAQMSAQRFSAVALYAAESGAAAAMSWIRDQHGANHLTPALQAPAPAIPGNGARPGEPGNLLSDDQQAWYEVVLLNNPGDPGGSTTDTDDIVIVQVTGHGPDEALRRLEWAVRKDHDASALGLAGWRDLF
jgi:hypothetical protein